MPNERRARTLRALVTATLGLGAAAATIGLGGCGPRDASVARDGAVVTATVGITATGVPGVLPTMDLKPVTPRPTETPDPSQPERAHALVVDGTDADRLYLTFVRGIMHSTDGGLTWTPLQASKVADDVAVIAAAQLSGGRLVVGGPGVLRASDDAGATWRPITPTLTSGAGGLAGLWRGLRGGQGAAANIDVRGLAVDPTDGRRLYGLFHGLGVAVSADEGATWVPTAGELPALAFGLWVIGSEPTVLVTTDRADGGLLRSVDGGTSWSPMAATGATGEWLALTRAGEGRVIGATSEGLFESADGGATWAKFGPFLRLVTAAVAPHDPRMIYAITPPNFNVFRSKDGGETWPGTGTPTPAAAPTSAGGNATPLPTPTPGLRP